MLPGLPNHAASFRSHRYSVSAEDSDLHADIDSPSGAVLVVVRVNSGVYLSSSDRSIPAFNVSNLAAGSRVILLNDGEIRGAGGDGGPGKALSSSLDFGGGGGGAGVVPGIGALGGRAFDPGGAPVNGEDGTEFLGGANGEAALYSQLAYPRDAATGEDGGTAILSAGVTITVYNNGTIWGGGGGAAGYTDAGPPFDVFGGDPGQPGGSHTGTPPGGAGGYAINGTDVTVATGGSSPDLEGDIG